MYNSFITIDLQGVVMNTVNEIKYFITQKGKRSDCLTSCHFNSKKSLCYGVIKF